MGRSQAGNSSVQAARGGSYNLTGRASNGRIEADLTNSQCTYHMSLTRG